MSADTLRDAVLEAVELLHDGDTQPSSRVIAAGMVLAIVAMENGISLHGAHRAVDMAYEWLETFGPGAILPVNIDEPIGEA